MSPTERAKELRQALAQALPGEARAAMAVALGQALVDAGDYATAIVELAAAREEAEAVGSEAGSRLADEAELLLGVALLRRREPERATLHLEHALERARTPELQLRAELALAEARVQRALRSSGEAQRGAAATVEERAEVARLLDRLEASLVIAVERGSAAPDVWLLHGRLRLGRAALMSLDGDVARAEALIGDALDAIVGAGDDGEGDGAPELAALRIDALRALATAKRARGDWAGAERAAREAVTRGLAGGLPRELAEAYETYAVLLGEAQSDPTARAELPDGLESPAALLARAQELYRLHGGLADLERVREGFRRFGRRAVDHVPTHEVRALLDDLRRTRRRLASAVEAIGEIDGAAAVAEGVAALAAVEERVNTAMRAVILERESVRTLLELCRALNEVKEPARLVEEAARVAAQVTGADRAVIALVGDGGRGLVARAAHQMPEPERESAWRAALEHAAAGGAPICVDTPFPARARRAGGDPSSPSEEIRLAAELAAPLRRGDRLLGGIYVDRRLCGGVFSAQDLDLLTIFAAQLSVMLANVQAREELGLAGRERAATLEALSEGVVTLDRDGAVTSVNRAAARMLGFAPGAQLTLPSLPELHFVRATLDRGEDIDGRMARIGGAEYLVNARALRTDAEITGAVVTLTELKRVQSIAQRLVGSVARYSFGDIVGQSPLLRRRLQLAEAAARSDSSVLITGESGTGKEVLAQSIHNASARASGPFVGINCSAIPRELLESELFGYEGGAFTGARRGGQPGKFELAEGGTILLDEIGDMPLEMQAKLLRVLQERRVARIGGVRETPVDARIVATTNRDLEEAVARGQFRADLLFRLKVIHIELPPLRERASDVPVLVEHYLSIFAARLGKKVRGLAPHVADAFARYPWPGNIRELENVLEAEVNLVDPEALLLSEIPDALRPRPRVTPVHGWPTLPTAGAAGMGLPSGGAPPTLDEAERELLVQALVRHQGAIPEVAKALGVSRGTVYNKLRRFALDADDFRPK
jgi:transcriptional regulator with PAS, ATPase and Fis domain